MKLLVFNLLTFIFFITSSNTEVTKVTDKEFYESSVEASKEIEFDEKGKDRDINVNDNHFRLPRNVTNTEKPKNISKIKQVGAPKVALVKKLIHKFTDTETEEDDQIKAKQPVKVSESVEHEDEDFNIDDYDFDIQHDEFAGQGKPLQPRMRVKLGSRAEKSYRTETKSKSVLNRKIVVPRNIKSYIVIRKTDKPKYEDDEESTETTEIPKPSTKSVADASDEDDSDDDSKEYEMKTSVRNVRSSVSFGSYLDKIGEKTSALMSKILSYLPIFPQIPTPKKLD